MPRERLPWSLTVPYRRGLSAARAVGKHGEAGKQKQLDAERLMKMKAGKCAVCRHESYLDPNGLCDVCNGTKKETDR